MLLRLIAIAVCVATLSGGETIALVSSLPHTGSAGGQANSIVNGIRMAIDEVGGEVAGFALTHIQLDDATPERGQWDPNAEDTNARNAIANPDAMVYIGTFNSGAAKIAMPKLNAAGLAMISPANTYTGLTKPGKGAANEPAVYRPSGTVTYFRVVPADDIQGLVGAQWAKEMGAKKAYVLHDKELYGQGLAEVFRASAEKLGIEVVGYDGINSKEPNYRSLVTKIRVKGADTVYFGGTTQTNGGQIAKDLVAGGLDVKYIVPDGCYESAFIEAAGAALEGRCFLTFGGVPPEELTGAGKTFVDAYVAKFGGRPEAYAVYGYECARVAIDAIRRAGVKDRAAINAAIAATRDFPGVLGTWSFDENGDTSMTVMSGNTVKDGKFAFVKLLGQ
ncbi:MAG TPA: branched-chain amino acid ABC transporter substrate-binding protein [Planctomycetota bacterium]|nr:branched-chain amino acid ABC transporter substrate-binding protein [Planctomycetota bacterium]